MTNKGRDMYQIYRTPTSLLDPSFRTNKFRPVKNDKSDRKPAFLGQKVKYLPIRATDLVTLRPNEVKTVVHELNGLYDFSKSGAGNYVLLPYEVVQVLDSSGRPQLMKYSSPPRAEIVIQSLLWSNAAPGQLVLGASNYSAPAQMVVNNCNDQQNGVIDTAALKAATMVKDGFDHITLRYSNWSDRLLKWFGLRSDDQADRIRFTLTRLRNQNFRQYTYDCRCNDVGTFAYVDPERSGYINICPSFWTAPDQGLNSKGNSSEKKSGIIVHEASHYVAIADTEDVVYGTADAQTLAREWREWAVRNADNFEYFVEDA
ncbi:hypothetical protein FRC07_012358 [Ceratobasidium sp. 392]|nr:hypothetical protein FRC07_012358 [Ceratobasidium sp. 392]